MLGKKWVEAPFDQQKKDYISQKHAFSEASSKFLAQKNLEYAEIENFLSPTLKNSLPDPDHLLDMKKASQMMAQIIKTSGKLGILADFDVDGATSAAILINFFRIFNIDPIVHIPDRIKEGYGPNQEALEKMYEMGANTIIILDCGTTNIELFNSFNKCDIIIIDHHVAQETLPNVAAIINPNRQDETSPCKSLCTAGLAFLFIISINRHLRDLGWYQNTHEPDLFSFLDLVALGTVCDMMPLTGLNRSYVTQGLKILNSRSNLGLSVLGDFIKIKDNITAYHLGFMFGPRINAGGRIGQSNLGVQLLTQKDPNEALSISAQLDYLNQERQALEKKMLQDAFVQAELKSDNAVLIIASENFHQGVIGIIAGRIKDHFHKPTIVMAINEDGTCKASARSISGFNIGSLFHKASHQGVIISGGGHSAAAGCSLRKDQLDGFQNFMEKEFFDIFQGEEKIPDLTYNCVIDIPRATKELCLEIERFSPFGMGNPTPKFRLIMCTIAWSDVVSGGHIRLTLANNKGERLQAMAFRTQGTPLEILSNLPPQTPIEVIGTLQYDTFFPDNPKVKFLIEDAKIIHL